MSITRGLCAVVTTICVAFSGCAAPRRTPPPAGDASPATTASPADDRTWVARENELPGTGDWRIRNTANETDLAGFADHSAVDAGERVGLRVTSTATSYQAIAYRLGHYGGLGAREVWRSTQQSARQQPKPSVGADNMVTAAWDESLSVPTEGWPAGSYLIKLVSDAGKQKYIPLTVRSQAYAGRLVLISATSTYQAYNEYGGYSLYRGPGGFEDRSRRVSFDRPYDRNGARLVTGFEQPAIAVAERLGLDLAYATSEDLDAGPQRFTGAAGLVSPGHDEYWSIGMRETVERLRDEGTNVAFLGANAVYWRTRYADGTPGGRRAIAGYKSSAEDPKRSSPDTTAMWRQAPNARPESDLVGLLYECFPAKGALRVHDPEFFLFARTQATRDTSFPGLIGVEIDRAYPIPSSPKNLQVVAHSPVACADRGNTFSDMSYYTTQSGAGVFSVGTMYWTKALLNPLEADTGITPAAASFAVTVTENLYAEMAKGPMGARHLAKANLADIDAPATTSTGTGGGIG